MPLSGLTILDLTTVLMGPYTTQILGDLGANIIKIESPTGDTVRDIGPARHAGMGGTFLGVNRNKRSISIDLKNPEGRALLLDLASKADALVYNLRPHVMERLGIGYETLAAINPKLIYLGLFGYGRNGPYASRPAYDDLIQAMTALPSLYEVSTGNDPRFVPFPIVDRFVGQYGAMTLLAALLERQRSGKGQSIDVPMYETMTSVVLADHLGGRAFIPPEGPVGYTRQLSRSRRPFPTLDGYVALLPYNDTHWNRFFATAGELERYESDPRFSDIGKRTLNIDALYDLVADITVTRTTAEWLSLMIEADIPVAPIYTLDEVFDDPHLREVGFFDTYDHPSEGETIWMKTPSQWSRTPPSQRAPAPQRGQDYREILAEFGLDDRRIDALVSAEAVVPSASED